MDIKFQAQEIDVLLNHINQYNGFWGIKDINSRYAVINNKAAHWYNHQDLRKTFLYSWPLSRPGYGSILSVLRKS